MSSTSEAVAPGASPARTTQAGTGSDLSWLQAMALSARLLLRDWRAGELRVLAVGLIVAVASLTTVAFFADRVRKALGQEANQLLGADLMVFSGRPFDATLEQRARQLGLSTVR